MRQFAQTAQTRAISFSLQNQDHARPYLLVFRGIRVGIMISLIFFWMPCALICLIFGILFVTAYNIALGIAVLAVSLSWRPK